MIFVFFRVKMLVLCKNFGPSLMRAFVLKEHLIAVRRQNRFWLMKVTHLSTSTKDDSGQERTSVSVSTSSDKQLSEHVKVTERIKQTTKDVTNISVILVGVGITCFILFVVFK